MKILCTGFTQRAVNSVKLRYDYVTSALILPAALQMLNHQVEHRAVTPGEDLSSYDLAVITVGPPKSLTARYLPGSAWAYHKCKRVLLAADDWSIEVAKANAESTVRCWDRFWPWYNDKGKWNETDRELTLTMVKQLIAGADHKMLTPMFWWGDHTILAKKTFPATFFAWDPTPLVKLPSSTTIIPKTRIRQWVLASLQGEPKLGSLTWPVLKVGNKRDGQAYIPEVEVLDLYRANWGVLCPPYKSAGSGWWRARYHWSASSRCVLWSHAIDRQYMGEMYQHNAQEYEGLSDEELAKMGQAQHDWFFANTASLQTTLNVLREVVG